MEETKLVGRKQKYGEKTQNITTRVPESKVVQFREHVKEWLKKFETKLK